MTDVDRDETSKRTSPPSRKGGSSVQSGCNLQGMRFPLHCLLLAVRCRGHALLSTIVQGDRDQGGGFSVRRENAHQRAQDSRSPPRGETAANCVRCFVSISTAFAGDVPRAFTEFHLDRRTPKDVRTEVRGFRPSNVTWVDAERTFNSPIPSHKTRWG